MVLGFQAIFRSRAATTWLAVAVFSSQITRITTHSASEIFGGGGGILARRVFFGESLMVESYGRKNHYLTIVRQATGFYVQSQERQQFSLWTAAAKLYRK